MFAISEPNYPTILLCLFVVIVLLALFPDGG